MTKHRDMWMNVDGELVHMLADPNMTDKQAEALAELVRLARKAIEEGYFDDPEETAVCPKCGRAMKPDRDYCGNCHLKEIQASWSK